MEWELGYVIQEFVVRRNSLQELFVEWLTRICGSKELLVEWRFREGGLIFFLKKDFGSFVLKNALIICLSVSYSSIKLPKSA